MACTWPSARSLRWLSSPCRWKETPFNWMPPTWSPSLCPATLLSPRTSSAMSRKFVSLPHCNLYLMVRVTGSAASWKGTFFCIVLYEMVSVTGSAVSHEMIFIPHHIVFSGECDRLTGVIYLRVSVTGSATSYNISRFPPIRILMLSSTGSATSHKMIFTPIVFGVCVTSSATS